MESTKIQQDTRSKSDSSEAFTISQDVIRDASEHEKSISNEEVSNKRIKLSEDELSNNLGNISDSSHKANFNSKSNLVLLNGILSTSVMKEFIENLKTSASKVSILQLGELKNAFHNSSSDFGDTKLNICIEYNETFAKAVNELSEAIREYPEHFKRFEEVAYHIQFDPEKKWSECPPEDIKAYKDLIMAFKDAVKEKITQCSIIDKYEISTIYLTEKNDLAKLGSEIQMDVENWENLKIFDYTKNCVRFFPGVKFPDSLIVLNISGSNSLETLSGFKMPSNLQTLIASSGCISNISNVNFPSSLRNLDLSNNKIYFLNYLDLPMKLEVLDLSNNRIENLKGLNFPPGLEKLSLSFNPIEYVKGARFPESLSYLDISYIPNESMAGVQFPESLESLNLQQSMTNTRGLKIPSRLRELNLGNNGLNSIKPLKLPDSIESLFLGHNNIKTLNKFQFPSSLKELYIGNNLITTLKNVQFPLSLQVLDVEMDPEVDENDKRITSLKDVSFPPGLKVLKLGYHSIKTVESFEFPPALEYLSLAYNELRLLRNVKFGKNLKKLDLSGNQDLISIDQFHVPDSVVELRVPSRLLNYLPAYIVERANAGELTLLKSLPY